MIPDPRPPAVRLAEAIGPFLTSDGASAEVIAGALVAAGWMQVDDFLNRIRTLLDDIDAEDEVDFDGEDVHHVGKVCDVCHVTTWQGKVSAPDALVAAAADASARAAGWVISPTSDICPACVAAL